MFTGLVEEVGTVISLRRHSRGGVLKLESGIEFETGDSVAVNGVCQTVSGFQEGAPVFDILPETLRVTNLGSLRAGARVNIERALTPSDRFGGHFVTGHVDGTGLIKRADQGKGMLEIEVDQRIHSYLVPKCSVAVDGISLTVGPELRGRTFRVYIIPHTWDNTNLESVRPGYRANIEIDMLAKYVYKFTSGTED
ncbi:MAG: riboflavin synthase [Candidatus Latescibacteria bacterium]|nr:riboflavin synthase [bacterium]MBD3424186.1 riboflavin synthase [Candidatus Latescibacterota bacterium]